MWDAHTNRKPMLLLRLFGWLLFQHPPRTARVCSQGAPPAEAGTGYLPQKYQKPFPKILMNSYEP